MIAKLIVHGRDRTEALTRLKSALEEFWIAGIRTGLPFLRRLVENAAFRKGSYDTGFIDAEMSDAQPSLDAETRELVLAAVGYRAALDDDAGTTRFRVTLPKEAAARVEVLSASNPILVRIDDREIAIEFSAPESDSSDRRSPIAKLRQGAAECRMTIVARKKGGFDVGLRDRALSVKCGLEKAGSNS